MTLIRCTSFGADAGVAPSWLCDCTYHRCCSHQMALTQASFARASPGTRWLSGAPAPGTALSAPGLLSFPAVWYVGDGGSFGHGDLPHLGLAHQYADALPPQERVRGPAFTLRPCGGRCAAAWWWIRFGNGRDADGDERPAEPAGACHNTSWTCLPARDFRSGRRIRARSGRAPRLLQMLDRHARDALVAAEEHERPQWKQEISLTAGNLGVLQSLATHKNLGVLHPVGHLGALTVIAGGRSGVVA